MKNNNIYLSITRNTIIQVSISIIRTGLVGVNGVVVVNGGWSSDDAAVRHVEVLHVELQCEGRFTPGVST